MRLTATFRFTSEGQPMFDGEPVSVALWNHGPARFRLQRESLAVETLDVVRWPFELALVSQVSP